MQMCVWEAQNALPKRTLNVFNLKKKEGGCKTKLNVFNLKKNKRYKMR